MVPFDGRDRELAPRSDDRVVDGKPFADFPDGVQVLVEGRARSVGHRDRPGPFDQTLFRSCFLRTPFPDAGDKRKGGEGVNPYSFHRHKYNQVAQMLLQIRVEKFTFVSRIILS